MAAYSIKELADSLKDGGLNLLEDETKLVVVRVFAWLDKSAQESTNPYDDFLRSIYPMAQKYTLEQADRIDGQVG